jgi:type IV secretory pathway VirB2 component (pilin)
MVMSMRRALEIFLVILITLATPIIVHAAQGTNDINNAATNITDTINNFMNSITNSTEDVINTALANLISFTNFLKNVIYNASEVLAILFGIIGGFLWLSGVSPYRGRRLVISAILLALLAIVIAHL